MIPIGDVKSDIKAILDGIIWHRFIGMGFMLISNIDFINRGHQLLAAVASDLPMAAVCIRDVPQKTAAGEKEASAQKPKQKMRKRPKGSADDPLGRRKRG